MNKKYLSFVCLLALTVGGCTQHMAKDDGSAPPVAESNQQSDGSQAKAAAENIKTQDAAPDTNVIGAAQQAGSSTATPDPAKTDKDIPPKDEIATASKLLPLPPKEIVNTINKLTSLPRVRYLSRTAQYDYYVGGRVDAKYDLNKDQLVVTNAPAEGEHAITCEYSKDGNMISGKNAIPSDKLEECNKLINELTIYLTR